MTVSSGFERVLAGADALAGWALDRVRPVRVSGAGYLPATGAALVTFAEPWPGDLLVVARALGRGDGRGSGRLVHVAAVPDPLPLPGALRRLGWAHDDPEAVAGLLARGEAVVAATALARRVDLPPGATRLAARLDGGRLVRRWHLVVAPAPDLTTPIPSRAAS